MDTKWIDSYFLKKLGIHKDFKEEWNATRYLIDDKMVAYIGVEKSKRPIITLKCDPEYGDHLRREYTDIIAGYYMNKTHWNSVFLDSAVPKKVLRDMIDNSHELIFAALTKKRQRELLAD